MKKMLVVLMVGVFVSIMQTGCGGCRNDLKHLKSGMIGLSRHITLYGNNGVAIREWDTRATVEDKGGSCYFIDAQGHAVIISGTFIIQEK